MENLTLSQEEKNTLTALFENGFDIEKTFSWLKEEKKSHFNSVGSFIHIAEERRGKIIENEATLQTRELFKSLGIKLNSIGKNLKKKS